MRVYLADINRSLQAQTELRTAILKALRDEGIDIPYASALDGPRARSGAGGKRATVSIGVSTIAIPKRCRKHSRKRRGAAVCRSTARTPQVAFEDIGDTALNFSVSVPLTDGVNTEDAETALRTQAVKTLRERGITLASPQRQVRLRDLEGLRAFLVRLAEERARRGDAEDGDAARVPTRKPDDD